MKKLKTLSSVIEDILSEEISVDGDPCYCEGDCCGGSDYVEGRYDALCKIKELLKKNGIDPQQLVK